jgi:class 3 adenylate cyclase
VAERAIDVLWEWTLPASPAQLWPLVSDTDRFNYDAGLPREIHAGDDRSAVIPTARVRMRSAGMEVTVQQQPFEWEAPHWFDVRRTYSAGPVAAMDVHCELEPEGGATRLRYGFQVTPRGWLARQLIAMQLRRATYAAFDKVFRRYGETAQELGEGAPIAADLTPAERVEFAPGGRERLAAGLARLTEQPVGSELVAKLGQIIERGDGFLACRVRPFVLADGWGAPRRGVLELCLRATRAGLLDLRWDLLCPLCRGAKHTAGSLSGVTREAHCDACNMDYEVNFERQVELSFRVNSAIRPAPDLLYCAGAPGLTPHIVAQVVVQPGEARELRPELEPGRYRLRCDNQPGGQFLRATAGGAGHMQLSLRPPHWPSDEGELGLAPTLAIRNDSPGPLLVMFERLAWADDAVTAAEVTALQLFRDLFSTEALRPDEQISVGNACILFTDLVGSTRLYRDIGDAPAFGRVMSHFDVLRQAIADRGGAVVKTMGDAVLGIFTSPLPALEAIIAAQGRLAEASPPLLLKAGIHTGPCIAVTLNERLDYFGTAVNFAARLAHVANGVEIVISDEVRADPEVAAWLEGTLHGFAMEDCMPELKGFEEDMPRLWRLSRE